MTSGRAALLLAIGLTGCATRAELVQQDHQLRVLLQEQRKQIQQTQHEVERLRADMEEGHGRPGGPSGQDRLSALEQRVTELERGGGAAPPPEAAPAQPQPQPPATPPAVATAPSPPPTKPRVAGEEDGWRSEVAREQAAAGSVNVPERGEYLGLLDGLARQDCARTVPQLNSFAANHKDSPLADNSLYWAARCYALKGDQNQAVSKFYDVVTKYPKGDKAPAALLAQGNLFVDMGDTPDARLALSKLIRDYPNSEEAPKARQKLSELEN